jgi:uncharacterized membrane protein YeaQ/YmgE (transglycosylase-associated protein family)
MLWTLLIGLAIGAVAKVVMPGRDPGGIIVTMLLGLGGSFVADLIGHELGLYPRGHQAGFVASVLGAVLILIAYRWVVGRSSR